MKLGNIAEECGCMKKGFIKIMNKDIKKQSGGFLVSLLCGLAASLIPKVYCPARV